MGGRALGAALICLEPKATSPGGCPAAPREGHLAGTRLAQRLLGPFRGKPTAGCRLAETASSEAFHVGLEGFPRGPGMQLTAVVADAGPLCPIGAGHVGQGAVEIARASYWLCDLCESLPLPSAKFSSQFITRNGGFRSPCSVPLCFQRPEEQPLPYSCPP